MDKRSKMTKSPEKSGHDFPQIPDRLAIPYITVTMIIMAYSFLFKVFPILIFLGLWLSHIYYKKTFILRPTADMFFILFIPVLCAYSAFWSDFPKISLYQGGALVCMTFCVIIMARTVSAEAYIKGITMGAMLVLIASLATAEPMHDEFSTSVAHVGLFGSKNEAGFFAGLGFYASLLVMFSKRSLREKFFFGFLPFIVSAVALYMSKSVSSDISLIIALAAACAVYFLHKLSPLARMITVCMGILSLITVGMLLSATNANMFDPILKVFGKDSTLTGRTYLWSEGIANGMKKPILGHGYFAFWVPGRPEAEHYWQKFEITRKVGFHFHDLYIQSFVDLGIIGLISVITLVFYSCYKSLRLAIKNGLEPEAGLALGASMLFLIRGFVEVDLFGPFGIGPFLYLSIIPRLARYRGSENVH